MPHFPREQAPIPVRTEPEEKKEPNAIRRTPSIPMISMSEWQKNPQDIANLLFGKEAFNVDELGRMVLGKPTEQRPTS